MLKFVYIVVYGDYRDRNRKYLGGEDKFYRFVFNTEEKAFHYSIPKDAYKKASVIALIAASVIILGTYLMGIFEPDADFFDVFFEVTSAYGTVGLSTGITPGLSVPSKLLSIIIMYIGRLGPWTVATLWHFSKGERVSFPEGNISIG